MYRVCNSQQFFHFCDQLHEPLLSPTLIALATPWSLFSSEEVTSLYFFTAASAVYAISYFTNPTIHELEISKKTSKALMHGHLQNCRIGMIKKINNKSHPKNKRRKHFNRYGVPMFPPWLGNTSFLL